MTTSNPSNPKLSDANALAAKPSGASGDASEARAFIREALYTIPWDDFRHELCNLYDTGLLNGTLFEEARNFLLSALRALQAGIELSDAEYLEAKSVLEKVGDVAFGPLEE